ncbi:MAG TPA: hypothetical protein VLM87_04675, partial [Rubrivivax sp.]|nr:hypothetical protein [Rubrivivax sp.]
MSLLDRITGRDSAQPGTAGSPPKPHDEGPSSNPMEATVRLGQSTLSFDAAGDRDNSIISEAAPSELAADYEVFRQPGDSEFEGSGSGLPLVGGWPLARQQRALAVLFVLGLAGLLVSAVAIYATGQGGAAPVGAAGFDGLPLAGGVLSVLLLAAGAFGLLRLFVLDQTRRSRLADSQRHEAERQEQEAKRVNDANQAAILRLMNELQAVAEGDLTQQATVTED